MRQPRINYAKVIDQALSDLENLIRERNRMDMEIVKLRETVRALSTMVRESEEQINRRSAILGWASLNTPNLTDSVRAALRGAGEQGMTAIETRDKLQSAGFDFSGFSNPLASVHTTLKRLIGHKEATYGNDRDGRPVYVWDLPVYGASASLANWIEDRRRDERHGLADKTANRAKK
jgi:hypothetical protein